MAADTYTSSLTAAECRDMLVDLLDLPPDATDEQVTEAYQEQKPDSQEASDSGDAEGAGDSAATEPAEEQMPMKGRPKYKGNAMMVISAKPRR